MSLTQQETRVLMDALVYRIAKLDLDVLELQDRCTALHQEILALKNKNGLK